MVNRFYVPTGDDSRDKAWRLAMEERMHTLETQQRLFNSSVKGGAIQVLRDEDAKLALNLGVGSYGQPNGVGRTAEVLAFLTSTSNNGQAFHLLIDEEYGWINPALSFNFSSDAPIVVTSGSYVTSWRANVSATGKALVVQLLVACDTSTTAQVRLNLNGLLSDAITAPANAQTYCDFTWNLTGKIEFSSIAILRIEVRRASGAGNVNVYAPEAAFFAGINMRSDATTGGISSGV